MAANPGHSLRCVPPAAYGDCPTHVSNPSTRLERTSLTGSRSLSRIRQSTLWESPFLECGTVFTRAYREVALRAEGWPFGKEIASFEFADLECAVSAIRQMHQ